MAGPDTTAFPGEVVTRAFVRFVDLPLGVGKAALKRFHEATVGSTPASGSARTSESSTTGPVMDPSG